MVERRFGLFTVSLGRGFDSRERLELSLEEAREEDPGEEVAATGKYCDECCLRERKRDAHMIPFEVIKSNRKQRIALLVFQCLIEITVELEVTMAC